MSRLKFKTDCNGIIIELDDNYIYIGDKIYVPLETGELKEVEFDDGIDGWVNYDKVM